MAYGVYALLEKLGCGFYLSYDALPPAKDEPFSFSGWQLADKPLARRPARVRLAQLSERLLDVEPAGLAVLDPAVAEDALQRRDGPRLRQQPDGQLIRSTARAKPVGYLSTTVKGRDWSTMHVNDVRRLWGGEVFNQPAFGAEAALVPEERRVGAAQQLMRDVFAYARQRAMDVYFANDIDTVTANPQELIQTLPLEARFATGTNQFWLANPDTPEGYRFYKAQVEALLSAYPQITWLVLWFRVGNTPWTELKVERDARRLAARVPGRDCQNAGSRKVLARPADVRDGQDRPRLRPRAQGTGPERTCNWPPAPGVTISCPPAIVSSRRTSS